MCISTERSSEVISESVEKDLRTEINPVSKKLRCPLTFTLFIPTKRFEGRCMHFKNEKFLALFSDSSVPVHRQNTKYNGYRMGNEYQFIK